MSAIVPASDPGQLDLSTLFSGMVVDPDQVYFLGITLADTPHPRHQVKATCNSLAVGMDYRSVTLREPVYEFGFYVDDGSVKPPRANIQEKLNPLPPHYFSTHAALGTIQGETVHGAIAHYTYRLHDTNLHPQIFARKWQLFKVENGNHTPMSTPGIPRGDRDVDLDFVAPADPGDEGVHYRLYCLTYDGRGVAGEPFSMGLTGDDLFYLKVGPDPTTDPGICLRVGWENTSGEVIPALDCDGNRFSEGKIFAMPVGPGIDPTEDYYGLRYAYATGSAGITAVDKHPDPLFSGGLHDPAYWHYKNPQPNQFPMSIQWRVRTRYGLSEYSGGTLVTYEPTIPDPDPFETNLSFDWRDPRPSEITPGMIVRIEMPLNRDEDHVPYFTLWIFNSSHPERNHHLVIPGANLSCLPANAGSSGWYSGWRVPDDIGTILDLEADEQAVLRAKVKWIDPNNDPLPCESGDPFLFDFGEPPTFDEHYLEVFADSAGVGGETGEPLSFDQFFFQTDGNPPTVTGATGSVNVAFIETHGGSLLATRFLWRWHDGTQYWHNGTWGNIPDFTEVDINGTDAFSQRWHWEEPTGLIEPAGPHGEPFAGFTGAFFGAGTSRTVTIETKMIFDQGGESIEVDGPALQITFNLNQTDVGIDAFTLDGGFGEISHLHTTQGQIPHLTFTIDTDSPDVPAVYLAIHREGTSLHCGTLTDLENENLFTVTQSTSPSGNLRYILTAGDTSELHNLLNGGTGEFKITVATDPCENGAVSQGIEPKTITVNPGQSFLVRVHYRDHLGSSVMSKAYSPVFAGSETGREPMKLSLGSTTLHLYPRPTEYHHYDPFGAPIPNVANEDDPRYTDHEYDPVSGFHYMKGRFQLAAIAKFNRPDPARDWDWMNPHSLNLYQYVRNNPINLFDPYGLFGEPATTLGILIELPAAFGRELEAIWNSVPDTIETLGEIGREYAKDPQGFSESMVEGAFENILTMETFIRGSPAERLEMVEGSLQEFENTLATISDEEAADVILDAIFIAFTKGKGTRGKTKLKKKKEGVERKKTKKERRAMEKAQARIDRFGDKDFEEPASEQFAKWRAQEKQKLDGRSGRRKMHDAKDHGIDRTKKELEEDFEKN